MVIAKDSTVKKLSGWRSEVGPAGKFDLLDAPDAQVIMVSDSRDMWAGFDQHFGGFIPDVPPGYTTMRTFPGQGHSLMISAGERPYTSGQSQRDQGTTLYSRLTWQQEWKRLHLGVTFALMGSDVYSWSAVDLAFDIQASDNSDRAHFRAELQDPWESGDAGIPLWKIAKNDTDSPGGWATVPGSRPSVTGENENKGGWNFARLSVDLEHTQPGATHGAGGDPDTIGRYLELQCNDKVLDLTTINDVGQGWQDPQDGDPIGDYRYGCNPGVGAWRSTRNPSRVPNVLFGPIYVLAEV